MNSELKQKSTEELIGLALTAKDEQIANECIVVLEYRGTLEVLEQAQKLCQSKNIEEKYLGINILGQLGIPERTFPDECLHTLLQLLEKENDPNILGSIGIALGHLQDNRAIQPLVKLKNHPHPEVRYGVVFGLLCQEDDTAIETLIELSSDRDENVRNWATFGLGSQIDINTNQIREALWQRLREEKKDTDTSHEIYGEALVGLARRKNERVIEFLLAEFESDCVGRLAVEAAEEIGDSRLYPALIKLKEWWDCDRELLERAIKSCHEST